jgi:hypothetical protein
MDEFERRRDDEADKHAARRDEDELNDRRGNRKFARRNGVQRQREQHERRRVIDDAFALDDGDHAARRAQFLHDGDRGGGVGRGENRPQDHRGRPGQGGDQPMRDGADRRHRRQHEADRQNEDRPQALAKLRPRQMQRGLVENWRQQDSEDDFRRDPDLWQLRNEGERRAADDQQYRIGQPQSPRDEGQRHAGHDQRDDDVNGKHFLRPGGPDNACGPPRLF